MKRIRMATALLAFLVFSPAILAQDLTAKSKPVLPLKEAASPQAFFAQFGKDYIPPVATVALLDSVGDDVLLFDRDINGIQLTIYWNSDTRELEVWKNGDWVDDLRVQYGNRIVFSGAYETRINKESEAVTLVATVAGSIVAGPEDTVIVETMNARGVVPAQGVSVAGNTAGPVPKDTGLMTCNCFGLGPGRTCSNQDCDEGKSCGKHRACRWTAPTV